jgi:membrane carboxypeptidase/penicillin-binding protein PbpC
VQLETQAGTREERRYDIIIMIQEQSQELLANFKTQDFWKASDKGTIAGLAASRCKGMTLKGTV